MQVIDSAISFYGSSLLTVSYCSLRCSRSTQSVASFLCRRLGLRFRGLSPENVALFFLYSGRRITEYLIHQFHIEEE
jgi:hypothetical protein